MTVVYAASATVIAILMCIGAHVLLHASGLLPYPIWPAVMIGSIMAGLFAASITCAAMYYVASAYFHLEAAREDSKASAVPTH